MDWVCDKLVHHGWYGGVQDEGDQKEKSKDTNNGQGTEKQRRVIFDLFNAWRRLLRLPHSGVYFRHFDCCRCLCLITKLSHICLPVVWYGHHHHQIFLLQWQCCCLCFVHESRAGKGRPHHHHCLTTLHQCHWATILQIWNNNQIKRKLQCTLIEIFFKFISSQKWDSCSSSIFHKACIQWILKCHWQKGCQWSTTGLIFNFFTKE